MSFKLSSMPSIHSIMSSIGIGGLVAQIPLVHNPHSDSGLDISSAPLANTPSCPNDGPLSCHSSSADASCCFISPGGQLLQTQFWDSNPAVGPVDSWTLHGLWPDLCDGTFDQFCTYAPQYTNITDILEAAGHDDLLSYMKTYWLPDAGSTENFWEHEFNKHATCINTLASSCYGDTYAPGIEVVDFFTRTVELFKTLDTYTALANAGITPSTEVTYTNQEIQDALTKVTGSTVVLGCNRGALNQAWYSYNVKGSLQTGEFVPTDPAGSGGKGTCPRSGIKYLPKRGGNGVAEEEGVNAPE